MPTELETEKPYPDIVFLPRALGLVFAGIAATAVFYELKKPLWLYLVLIAFCLTYPYVARWRAMGSNHPRSTEIYNSLFVAFVWGLLIPLIQFNLIPSILLLSTVSLESFGGLRLYFRGLMLSGLGIFVGILLFGFEFRPITSFLVMVALIPSLLVFPVTLGLANFELSRRLVRQRRKALQQSRTDGLSGLYNRDYFDERAQKEYQRCMRGGQTATFVLLDIDHFKQINDRYGHLAGDEIIKQTAEILRSFVRDVDIVARYGGEEFSLCLVNTNATAACSIAERIRQNIAYELEQASEIFCTVSFGVAEFSRYYSDYSQWVDAADKALYRAKANGRNRVEVSQPPADINAINRNSATS